MSDPTEFPIDPPPPPSHLEDVRRWMLAVAKFCTNSTTSTSLLSDCTDGLTTGFEMIEARLKRQSENLALMLQSLTDAEAKVVGLSSRVGALEKHAGLRQGVAHMIDKEKPAKGKDDH